MMLSLVAPGIVLVAPRLLLSGATRIQEWLQRQSVSEFLTYILIVAVSLRVIVVILMPLRLISDFATYDELAMLLVTHGEYTDGAHATAYYPPGWPYVLSLIYRSFGHHPQLGIVANIVFGAATIILTWLLVRRIWGELTARWAALLVAVLPSEVFFANVLGSEGLFTFLLMAALVLLLPQSKSQWASAFQALVGGAVLGLATLTRSLTPYLPLVLAAAYLVRYGKSWRALTLWVACVIGLAAVVTPWIVRNAERVGRATICTNTGVNLYVGNNPNAGVGFNDPDRSILFLRSGADEARDDSVGFARGVEYIRERPIAFLVRGVLKTVFFLTSDTDAILYDLAMSADACAFSAYSWIALVMQACWMMFLVAVGLGVFGFLRTCPWEDSGGVLLLGVIMYWIAIHFVFYGGGRYHMPIVPAMAAFAGLATERLAIKRTRLTE
jgi:4-amino-4-deoxy-L-arabinose transferase-like glycosyltransferase